MREMGDDSMTPAFPSAAYVEWHQRGGMTNTRHDERHPADVVRANGWGVGTRLVGDEGYGPAVIEITAVGERAILAKLVRSGMIDAYIGNEATWRLGDRDWRPVGGVPPDTVTISRDDLIALIDLWDGAPRWIQAETRARQLLGPDSGAS